MRLFDNIVAVEGMPTATMMDFDNNNVDYAGVKNDGMSDQESKQSNNRGNSSGVAAATGGNGNNYGGSGTNGANDNRPGSARSNRERHERVILLKERQNSERIKKLEELKEQALAAARLREEQDSKRRKHFEELGRRDEERRRQAEERRRMLEEERRVTLQAKWEGRRQGSVSNSSALGAPVTPGGGGANNRQNKPIYAFGSCTPRLLDNHVDGLLWKSQYNLNVTKEPGLRASSAHDLHLQQKEVRMSTSMYEWNQHRTTPENPLVHNNGSKSVAKRSSSHRHKNEGMDTPTRVFCGRRKTDLTPTIPIKRDDYSVMSRSTSRGSGRVYSSMTRLDRSRSPGGALTQYQHHGSSNLHHSPQRPSRSKSTTHLQSAGLKLTRTEILRQALASKKESSGIRSVDASRPPSSMSSSIMTSSTHSTTQVQMRPRNSYVRKARPASVHVTGVSADIGGSDASSPATKDSSRRSDTPQSIKSSVSRKASNEPHRRPTTASSNATTTSGKSSGKTSPSPQQLLTSQSMVETSTMKRPIKKKISPSVSNSNAKLEGGNKGKTPEPTAVGTHAKTPEPSVAPVKSEPREQAASPIAELADSVAVTAAPVQVKVTAAEQISQQLVDNQRDVLSTKDKELFEIIPSVESQLESPAVNNKLDASNNKNNIENFESIESAFASGSEDFTYSSKTPEPFAPSPGVDSTSNTVSELLESAGRDSASTNATLEDGNGRQEWSNPFITNITPEPTKEGLLKPEEEPSKAVSPVPVEGSIKEEGEDGNMESQKPKITTEAEAKAALAEKRRLAREAVEKEAARIAELEILELERQRLEEEEAERMAVEARRLEEERLRKAIEEEQKRQEEEKKRKEEEEKARLEKERQERVAAKEAERIRLEMEERLRREEAERLERKRRVEAIMSRTRKKEAEQQQAKANNTNSNNASSEMVSQQNDLNGHKENIINQENIMQSSVNSLNNNFNNNNDFSGTSNNDLIDNNSTSTSTVSSNNTLISFDGMSNSSPAPTATSGQLIMDNAVDLLNFSQQQNQQQTDGNISPDLLGSTTSASSTTPTPALVSVGSNSLTGASPNNSIINNSQLQEKVVMPWYLS